MLLTEIHNILLESAFKKLKDNKIPLTPEERKTVISKKATWSDGNSAIWKSKDNKGKTVYGCNTHRVYQIKPTLKGAIAIFHSFVKGTA